MTLGRTSSGSIKIKTDTEGGGLRAVECACCEGEPSCCMYPATYFGQPRPYTKENLPEAVTINWPGRFNGTLNVSGHGFTNGNGNITLSLNTGETEWELTDNRISPPIKRKVGNCLIRGDGAYLVDGDLVEDQFPAVLSVEFSQKTAYVNKHEIRDLQPAILTRTGICTWDGISPGGIQDWSDFPRFNGPTGPLPVTLRYRSFWYNQYSRSTVWDIWVRRPQGALEFFFYPTVVKFAQSSTSGRSPLGSYDSPTYEPSPGTFYDVATVTEA